MQIKKPNVEKNSSQIDPNKLGLKRTLFTETWQQNILMFYKTIFVK